MASRTAGRFTKKPRRRGKIGKRARAKGGSKSPRAKRSRRRFGKRRHGAAKSSFFKGGFKFMGIDVVKTGVQAAVGGGSLFAHGWLANKVAAQSFVPAKLQSGIGKTLAIQLPLALLTTIAARMMKVPGDILAPWAIGGLSGVGLNVITQTLRPQDSVGVSGHESLEEQLGAVMATDPMALQGLVAVDGGGGSFNQSF